MRSPLVRSLAALAAVGSLATACSGAPRESEALGSAASAIVDGTPSDESQNAVVRLVILDPANSASDEVCTGTLLAPDIVLTARHCVSRAQESVTCLEVDGKLVGGEIFEDHQPENIIVLVGTNPDRTATDAKGAKIFHDSATNLCGHDLAVVVLDRRLGLASPIAPIRLASPPTPGQRFTAVGWGTNGAAFPAVRQQRTNVTVEDLGPTVKDLTTGHRVAIGSNELLTDEADCAGDSGGPALDPSTGAIIAVASRSGVGASNPASPCRNSKNVYTAPAGFQDIVASAFAGSGEETWLEGNPQPPRLGPTPPSASSSSKGGCSVGAAGEHVGREGWLVGAFAALALALAPRRRRECRNSDQP